MKKLSNTQNYIFIFGGFMMVVGAGLNMVADFFSVGEALIDLLHKIGACVFMLGSLCFASMQIMQTYSGNSIVISRLRSIQVLGDISFVLSGLLLLENAFRIVYPYFTTDMDGLLTYARYINNNWVVFLLIAAILEVYTTHRISHELSKENNQ